MLTPRGQRRFSKAAIFGLVLVLVSNVGLAVANFGTALGMVSSVLAAAAAGALVLEGLRTAGERR